MKYIVIFILAVLVSNVRAQYVKNRVANYEGSVELNSAVSLNDAPLSMFGIETIHRVLVGDCVFVGLGAGVNIVHFTPYFEELTGDITPEMFHYDWHKCVCPTVSFNMGFRLNNIRKLRRSMIPFVEVKFMYLWNFKNATLLSRDFGEIGPMDTPATYVGGFWGQFCIGTEFKLRNLPNMYIGCGWMITSRTAGEVSLEWSQRMKNNSESEEEKVYRGGYKMKGPVPFFIRIGMRLWKKE